MLKTAEHVSWTLLGTRKEKKNHKTKNHTPSPHQIPQTSMSAMATTHIITLILDDHGIKEEILSEVIAEPTSSNYSCHVVILILYLWSLHNKIKEMYQAKFSTMHPLAYILCFKMLRTE